MAANTTATDATDPMFAAGRIGLILPNRNHAHFLPASLAAIERQTRAADQLVIIDDGSTDNSYSVIEGHLGRAGHRFPQNTLIIRNSTSGGVVRAMLAGLQHLSTEYVAFVSADDRLDPRFVEHHCVALDSEPRAAFSSARVRLVDENDQPLGWRPVMPPRRGSGYISPDGIRRLLAAWDNYFLSPVTVFRRTFLIDNGAFDERLGPTADGVALRLLAARHGCMFVDETLGIWRQHATNFSANTLTDPQRFETIVAQIRHTFETQGTDVLPRNYARLFDRRLRFNACRLLLLSDQPDDAIALRLQQIGQLSQHQARHLCRLAGARGPGRHTAIALLTAFLSPYPLGTYARLGIASVANRFRGASTD